MYENILTGRYFNEGPIVKQLLEAVQKWNTILIAYFGQSILQLKPKG